MAIFYSIVLVIATTLTTLLLYKLWIINKTTKAKSMVPPEPPSTWPILGHLHLLMGPSLPHRALAKLAQHHGPLFSLRLGRTRTMVVSTMDLARECFTTNDRALANRPTSIAKIMTYDGAMIGASQYGPDWREVRKIMTLGLFSISKIERFKQSRASEIDIWIKELYDTSMENEHTSIGVKQRFEELMFSMAMKMIAGKSYFGQKVSDADVEVGRRFLGLLKEFNDLAWVSGLYAGLPFLAWVDFHGHVRDMRRVAKEMDMIIESWVEEHGRKSDDGRNGHHFIDFLLSTIGKSRSPVLESDPHTLVKATIMGIHIGAVDSTSSTMEWALTLLMKNPHKLKKLQAELDIHVGKNRKVEESDIMNLDYLQAVVKETLRLFPPGPLLLPHVAIEDCNVGGFHVARGTQVLVNAWKIHRDPHLWRDPEEFHPERFLPNNEDHGYSCENMEIIPFGLGRRSCPANVLALRVMQLVLARLLQSFELVLPSDVEIDMEEGFRAGLFKLNPLQVLLKPRLTGELY